MVNVFDEGCSILHRVESCTRRVRGRGRVVVVYRAIL